MWDSSQVGFIVTSPERIKELGVPLKDVNQQLINEIKIYDMYIRGEVYGFRKFTKKQCITCHNVEDVDGDSCWGFFGSDHEESGLLDSAGITDFDDWEEQT